MVPGFAAHWSCLFEIQMSFSFISFRYSRSDVPQVSWVIKRLADEDLLVPSPDLRLDLRSVQTFNIQRCIP